MLRSY